MSVPFTTVVLPPGQDYLYLRTSTGSPARVPVHPYGLAGLGPAKRESVSLYREACAGEGPGEGFVADAGGDRFAVCVAPRGTVVISRAEYEAAPRAA